MRVLVSNRLEITEAEVFQFTADFAHAQPVRDGSVNVQSFTGNFLLTFGVEVLESPHVVQPICQFDQHYADVVHHRQHHLAEILRLLLLARGEIYFADFGDTLDDVGHLLTKFFADFNDGHGGVFDRIVQQAGSNRNRVHLHLGQDAGHFDRMDEVGFSRGATLAGVILLRELVSFADDFQIIVWPVGRQVLHQVTEARDGKDVGRDLFSQSRHDGLYPFGIKRKGVNDAVSQYFDYIRESCASSR